MDAGTFFRVEVENEMSLNVVLDSRSQMLQSLAARLQLLSDAPEQLFRLLERRQYLHATFLFLLARVVYRTMVQEARHGSGRRKQTEGYSALVREISTWCLFCTLC